MASVRQKLPDGGSLRQAMQAELGVTSLSVREWLLYTIWRPAADTRTAIALSGGGAKGSFEVGALHFLAESGLWEEMNIAGVCGTSVGAINTLGLAQGNRNRHIAEMVDIWMRLNSDDDMYQDKKWLSEVRESFPEYVEELEDGKKTSIASDVTILTGLDTVLGFTPIGWIIDLFQAFQLNKVREAYEHTRKGWSLYSLRPTVKNIESVVDFDKLMSEGLDLRLVAIDLVSGAPAHFYIDREDSQNPRLKALVPKRSDDPLHPFDFEHPVSKEVAEISLINAGYTPQEITIGAANNKLEQMRIVAAAMASAAIPGVFSSVRITLKDENNDEQDEGTEGIYVDGGVRDILPIEAAGTLDDVDNVIAISAAPEEIGAEPDKKWSDKRWRDREGDKGANWIAHIERLVWVLLSEIHRQDVLAAEHIGFDLINVAPGLTVHKTQEIDPGAIRINAAYGYMRAYDEFRIRVENDAAKRLRHSSHRIARLRRQIWNFEKQALRRPEIPTPDPRFDSDLLHRIRNLKKQVAKTVSQRVIEFGLESIPTALNPDWPVARWWTDWERHGGMLGALYRPIDYMARRRVIVVEGDTEVTRRESDDSFQHTEVNIDERVLVALS